jgi:2,3-bisphosphoglycerate-independent phosphoglycerate mutase
VDDLLPRPASRPPQPSDSPWRRSARRTATDGTGGAAPDDARERDAAAATARRLIDLYQQAYSILDAHPINAARAAAGQEVANAIWAWSPGRRPQMPTLSERFGVSAAVISAVDLIKGLGHYAGMDIIDVPGATGLHDTNYEGKAEACLDALADHDFVYVHVEASDEASHARDLELKIRCIEYLDRRLVRVILEGLAARGIAANIAVLPDHPTPVETGQHGRDPVPVAMLRPGDPPDDIERYDEETALRGSLGLMTGETFMRQLLTAAPSNA